jgi:hypothetical protein
MKILQYIYRPVFLLLLTATIFFSCRKLQQDIPINLPPFHSQLGVECYLGPLDPDGCPINNFIAMEAAISQTQDYFKSVDLNSLQVKGATVTVSFDSAGKTYTDTLREDKHNVFNSCDTGNIKFFNYKRVKAQFLPNPTPSPIHFHTGLVYKLRVDDHTGRVATAQTTWLDTAHIDYISTIFNARDTNYSLIIHWHDVSPGEDFYRIQIKILNLDSALHRGRILRQDAALNDNLNNNGDLAIGTRYSYKKGDKIEVKLFHIQKEYYQYLRTVSQAVNSMGNPFGQPAVIASNVTGGIGIFTVIPWTKKVMILQ